MLCFQGPWVHPEIDNPEYSPDANIYLRKELCAIGFDLWQVKSGTIFDDILITDDLSLASTKAAAVKETQVKIMIDYVIFYVRLFEKEPI